MGLFDGTAKHLGRGPTVLFPADPADAMAEALLRYDPEVRVKGDKFVFHNGVHLNGPVEVTADLSRKASLPAGMSAAYYASIVETGTRGSRPDDLKRQDAERLVRGLAARMGGTVHDERPPMQLDLDVSVYSAQPLPVEQVTSVMRPFFDHEIIVDEDKDVKDAYYLVTEEEPVFFVTYWPPRLSRSRLAVPPPALGELRGREPCRWDLQTKFPAATAAREVCLRVGEAALALARQAGGVVIDPYGFPVDRPGDLLPGGS